MNPSKLVKLVCSVLILSFAGLAWACFWDSDTLRTEANGMPGVVEAVTGFFPVYPDEYYERRIEIAEERLAADPDRLESYDDIAVSLDRLGDSTAAIAAIEPKLAVVERLGDDAGDHLYRYHANIGTFYAHRWIRNGGDAEDLADLEAAREQIARAIEINPDAHFGREFVQLGAIEWLLNSEAGSLNNMWIGEYPTMLSSVLGVEKMSEYWEEVPEDVVLGLLGLVTLGAAQESVDVYTALAIAMTQQENTSLGLMAALRVDELVAQGLESLHPVAFKSEDSQVLTSDFYTLSLLEEDFAEVESYFDRAREAADEYRIEYASFVQQQLDSGLHPDTDEAFFDGEPEALLPEMPNGFYGRAGTARSVFIAMLLMVGFGFLIVTGMIAAVVWYIRR